MKYLIYAWIVIWAVTWTAHAMACKDLAGKYALYTSDGPYKTVGNAACLVFVAPSGRVLDRGGCISDDFYGVRGGRLTMDPECFVTGRINVGKERVYIRFSTMSLNGETITGVLSSNRAGEVQGSFTMVRWRKSLD